MSKFDVRMVDSVDDDFDCSFSSGKNMKKFRDKNRFDKFDGDRKVNKVQRGKNESSEDNI
jgi:hypothetical protein